jgi:hypothetical protein
MTRLLLLAALVGCAPRPQAVEPVASPVPFCFAAVARFNGKDQAAQGCFATAELCANAQRRAIRLGGLAGIRTVGACKEER